MAKETKVVISTKNRLAPVNCLVCSTNGRSNSILLPPLIQKPEGFGPLTQVRKCRQNHFTIYSGNPLQQSALVISMNQPPTKKQAQAIEHVLSSCSGPTLKPPIKIPGISCTIQNDNGEDLGWRTVDSKRNKRKPRQKPKNKQREDV